MAPIIAPKRPIKDRSSILSAFFTKNSYNRGTETLELQVDEISILFLLSEYVTEDLLTSLTLLTAYKVAPASTRRSPLTGSLPPESDNKYV